MYMYKMGHIQNYTYTNPLKCRVILVIGPSLTVPTAVVAHFQQSNLKKSEFIELTFEKTD